MRRVSPKQKTMQATRAICCSWSRLTASSSTVRCFSSTTSLSRKPFLNRAPVKIKLPDGTVLDRNMAAAAATQAKDPVFSPIHSQMREEEKILKKVGKKPMKAEDFVEGEEEGALGEEYVSGLGQLEYKRLETTDNLFRNMIMEARQKNKKKQKEDPSFASRRKFMVEGHRLVREAIQAGLEPEAVFFCRDADLRTAFNQCPPVVKELLTDKLYKTTYKTMQLWSDLTTSPGIMGVFNKSALEDVLEEIEGSPDLKPFSVILDNVRDPGNMGSMLRSAAAAGCREVFLTKGCVDAWDFKVLRGGMGAHFRLPIYEHLQWSDIRSRLPREATLFVADSEAADTIPYRHIQPSSVLPSSKDRPQKEPRHAVLVVGGETEGISGDAYRLLTEFGNCQRIHVPLARGMDSLNVSAAFTVLAFHLAGLFESSDFWKDE